MNESSDPGGRSTRTRLLDAGVELMLEQPTGTGFSHVRAIEVSRRAGLSHGAFYHHWASQDDFQAELLEHVLSMGRSPNELASFTERMTHVDPEDPAGSIRRAMNSSFEQANLVPWRLWVALVARNEPAIDEKLADRYRQVSEAFQPSVEAVLRDVGLRPRSPIDAKRLDVLVDSLWEGLSLRRTVAPELVDGLEASDERGETWSLYALGVTALLLGALEPIDDHDGTINETIERLPLNARG